MAKGPDAEWIVLADEAAVRDAALQRILACATRAQEKRGVFHVALAGGSTPRKLYEAWRRRTDFDWRRTEVFWGDERAVPAQDSRSNFHMAWESLLQHVPIPTAAMHRMPADQTDLDEAARQYETLLRSRLGEAGRLDLVLLGLGTDGHTASLFPHMASLGETRRWVVATPAPEIAPRLTGTAPWFNAARQALFLVVGERKRPAVARLRADRDDADSLPARLIRPHDGTLTWLIDMPADGNGSSLP